MRVPEKVPEDLSGLDLQSAIPAMAQADVHQTSEPAGFAPLNGKYLSDVPALTSAQFSL
jgi:hypothetical protein